ncbi:MAG: triphosphoribosyl-dephospho-CoA synthase [Hyphomicrobiales bacterium]|nr:triphosphoribosyl-dephospho-CoA synthase [Hyphomicrobiales bacterium]
MTPGHIQAAFEQACRAELEALKPGNVHIHAAGHGMSVEDFIISARVAAPHMAMPGAGVGMRIETAMDATFAAVGKNTNLGILLLCAPLAVAAEQAGSPDDLRAALHEVLAALTRADAAAAFRAIVLASPAGLGAAPQHDVRAVPDVTLLQAMSEAAARDRIAWQYAHDFADVFAIGLPALQRHGAPWNAAGAYLAFLAAFPDSHIARKHSLAVAEAARAAARPLAASFAATTSPEPLKPELAALDAAFKRQNLNPGTSADLTVASLFAKALGSL